jgi:O-antigen ligase
LFLVVIIASASQAADVKASAREIVKWLELLVVYAASASLLRSLSAVRWIVAAVVAAGVIEACLGFAQFGFNLGPQAFATGRLFLRAYGTFDQPNPYAGYLNMVLPFAVALGILGETKKERALYRLAALLIAGAILVSESRGALLAGLLATAVVLALIWRPVRAGVWLAALAGLVGAWLSSFGLVPVGPFQRALSVVGLGGVSFEHVTDANFSTVERAAHWLAGVRMFAAHPLLGVGIGNYADAYPAYHPRGWYASLQHAHNYYINIAAEAGVVGLAAYVLLVGSALWYSYATLKSVRNRLLQAAVLGVLGALVATSFHNLFDVLYVHGTVALLGLLMALVPVALRCTEGDARDWQQDGA